MVLTYFNEKVKAEEKYIVNYHRIKKIKDKILITTDSGSWVVLDKKEYRDLITYNLTQPLFKLLEEKFVLLTERNTLNLLNNHIRRRHFLFNGPSLHIIVPTLRCNQKCSYCHSSAADSTSEKNDMDFETAKKILSIGFEMIVVNTHAIRDPDFITRLSEHFGNQSVIGSIDIKKDIWGKYKVYTNDGTTKTKFEPMEWSVELERRGAGELLITSMDRDGTWKGYDTDLINKITEAVNVPVIANGGAGSIEDIENVVKRGNASAVALGSMVVYQSKGMGVLVNFPDKLELEKIF